MKTRYFTFGQNHQHSEVFNANTVLEVTHEEPREFMIKRFGKKWSMEYEQCPDLEFFPNGVVSLNFSKFEDCE